MSTVALSAVAIPSGAPLGEIFPSMRLTSPVADRAERIFFGIRSPQSSAFHSIENTGEKD
jgi:hypothetical protein